MGAAAIGLIRSSCSALSRFIAVLSRTPGGRPFGPLPSSGRGAMCSALRPFGLPFPRPHG